MTLTEEQRAALKRVAAYMDEMYSVASPYHGCTEDSDLLRAMIDSSEHVTDHTKMIDFDLEAARAADEALPYPLDANEIWVSGKGQMHINPPNAPSIFFTLSDLCEFRNLFHGQAAEIERLRPFEIAARDLDSDLGKIAGERDEQSARIKELEADLEQSERVIEARLDVIDQQAARIQELGGMLSIRTEELEIAHSCARSEREMHEKELVVFARKIAELEDALVEGLTNFLHYRASCYDPARRCPYAKECDDCSTWDACGHVEKFRSEARQRLQADGKIGPGARPPCWQITEERMRAITWAEEMAGDCNVGDVLRAMLEEGE